MVPVCMLMRLNDYPLTDGEICKILWQFEMDLV